MSTPEHARLAEVHDDFHLWRRWGPYVSDRAWGTVREDYSPDGTAWDYFPHSMARSRAYRWGEDGIAGLCDRYQILLFAPAFWNERDSILKERLFGVTNAEGNHGEDVKEYYFHLDNTPTHSYMRFLYKYPQTAFPYDWLVEESQRRTTRQYEFELLDTGLFQENRYFDIVIEYAKTTPDDMVIRIEAFNRGPEPAPLHIVPHLWFRNVWSWRPGRHGEPAITLDAQRGDVIRLFADDTALHGVHGMPSGRYTLGTHSLYAPSGGMPLFTNNDTNRLRVFGQPNLTPFVKDAFHRQIIQGEQCTNPANQGTKAAVIYHFAAVPPGGSVLLRFRLTDQHELRAPLADVDSTIALRRSEADQFYQSLHATRASDDEKQLQRHALAGLLWTKQSYIYDVNEWLEGDDPSAPLPPARAAIRNTHWRHLNSMRVMTVPDKWEYPWFAAWDLAFQCIPMALVDANYAKEQLWVLLFEQFMHPNGQIPAYEWDFSDLNPPVHAWAVWRVYNMDRIRNGKADRDFLERCFQKLLMNFAWWVNKVDRDGNNIFEGGFLGLDNIAVFDRSVPCADGGILEQADATGWMGMFCLTMMRIALELAKENRVYEGMAIKFFQHYAYVAAAMKKMGNRSYPLWDDDDGFFYDVLRYPDGRFERFRVRSLVGLIPLFAVERLEMPWIEPFKDFTGALGWFLRHRPDITADAIHTVQQGGLVTHVLTILNQNQATRILQRLMDPDEFLSPYGVRSLSKYHEKRPFVMDGRTVAYEPAESIERIKGGNSNWRGPIWTPTCFLLIESLRKLAKGFGQSFQVPLRCRNGQSVTLPQMAQELADRLISIFTRGSDGRRPTFGGTEVFQQDPHWRDLPLFYEYFHGDNGAGLGASHQTGWTALLACLIDEWRQ